MKSRKSRSVGTYQGYKRNSIGLIVMALCLVSCNRYATENDAPQFTELVRYLITDSTHDVLSEFLEVNNHLPKTLEDMNRWQLLRDPVNDDRMLSYERLHDNTAIVYSLGFDNDDDRGLVIFPPTKDPTAESVETERVREGRITLTQDESEMLDGDLVLLIRLLNSAMKPKREISLTWLNGAFTGDKTLQSAEP